MNELERLTGFEGYDWRQIYPVLHVYAKHCAAVYFWKKDKDLPKGNEPIDLVQEAITKVITGERRWDPQKEPDLVRYLKMTIKSLIRNLLASEDYKKTRKFAIVGDDGDFHEEFEDTGQSFDARIEFDDIWQHVVEITKDDDEIQLVLMYMSDGITTRKELAEALGLPATEIDNISKRIKRKVQKEFQIERG